MNINELKVLEWNNERVLTTKELAQVYGCKEVQIRQNFKNHKERYIEGKHYHTLRGDDLKLLVENFDLQMKKVRHLNIWTKKGAFMVAKLLDTDGAWEMYDQLVDFYFDVSTKVKTNSSPSNYVESIDLLKAIVNTFEETNKRIDFLEQKQEKFEDNIWLSPLHYNNVKSMVKSRIHELYEGTDTKMAPKYRELYKSINNMCNVTTLKQVKDSDYEKVINHILSWVSLKGDVVSG